MRRSFQSLLVSLLAALCLVAVAVMPAAAGPDQGGARLTASADGNPLGVSNSKNGVAVLQAGGMFPGDPPVTGAVTIKNTGDVNGVFALGLDGLHDTAGPNGGALSEALDLRIDDVTTSSAAPAQKYAGKLGAMGSVALGEIPKGAERTYLFTASLPAGADDRYQGSSTSTGFVWTETEGDDGAVAGSSEEGGPGEGTSDQSIDDGEVAGDAVSPGSGDSTGSGSGDLPFTGLGLVGIALAGAAAAASGLAIRRRVR